MLRSLIAGCTAAVSAALLVSAGAATAAAAQVTHVVGSDIEIVRTLRPAPNCVDEVLSLPTVTKRITQKTRAAAVAAVTQGCAALTASANEFPPRFFPSRQIFEQFAATKEHRGILAIPQYDLTCTDGMAGGLAQNGVPLTSPGYTKIAVPGQSPTYVLDESAPANPRLGGSFTGTPVVVTAGDGRSVDVAVRVAGRVANPLRTALYRALGVDVPYTWTVLHEKLSCAGTVQATVTYSDFPAISVYVGGMSAYTDIQTTELARFLSDGGRVLTAPGRGRFDPVCRIAAVTASGYTPITVPSSPTRSQCEQSARTL